MSRRALTLLPILLGGATGAAFALVGAEPRQPAERSNASQPNSVGETEPTLPLGAPPQTSSVQPSGDASGETREQPPPPAAAPGVASSKSAAPAFDLSALTTKEELLSTEVRCNQKSPEDCERAAETLEQGQLFAKDPIRAMKLRRAALTLYVKQCETGRAPACARLAEMYEQGILVKANQRSAIALRDRVTTLCKGTRDDSMCR